MTSLIPTIEPTAAQHLAASLVSGVNEQLNARVGAHRRFFTDFWDSSTATPDEILVALGPCAGLVLGAASESVMHIGNLAALVNKQVSDFLPAEEYEPRREFIPQPDGTVTLAPPTEGFDAWGKPIPIPEPA